MPSIASGVGEQSNPWSSYAATRLLSEQLAAPLSPEDQTIQSMPDASPTKWHLAHTSWFFETFILEKYLSGYKCFHPEYKTLFNSYYNQVGEQFSRPHRGLISRPGAQEILEYRHHVDNQMESLLGKLSAKDFESVSKLLVLGINHEQQHQELLITDIKHAFSFNPSYPVYTDTTSSKKSLPALHWETFDAGIYRIGYEGADFYFDNETPSHRFFQERFAMGSRPVTNAEYLDFMNDGGYQNPSLWLSEGWSWVNEKIVDSPLYWVKEGSDWMSYTLGGLQLLSASEPVIHLSYYEADAFARWAGARLPTEQEWEIAAQGAADDGRYLNPGRCHPETARDSYFGDVWSWTSSAYSAYPGFKTPDGAIGEYNGKFMCNQFVLRGGSCATPEGHIRPSYRNFFPSSARWQFSGVRLAKDA